MITFDNKVGRYSVMKVNKQKVSKNSKKVIKEAKTFIGKPTPKYTVPKELVELLNKYVKDDDEKEKIEKKPSKKSTIRRKTTVNGFTAFRAYYSRYGKTYKEQEQLSKELALFWKKEPSVQELWRGYSEEYKASDICISFVEWFITYKSTAQPQPRFKIDDYYRQPSNLSHLLVEDVYDNSLIELRK